MAIGQPVRPSGLGFINQIYPLQGCYNIYLYKYIIIVIYIYIIIYI